MVSLFKKIDHTASLTIPLIARLTAPFFVNYLELVLSDPVFILLSRDKCLVFTVQPSPPIIGGETISSAT